MLVKPIIPLATVTLLTILALAPESCCQVKGGPTSPDGKAAIATDLPPEQRMKNTGGSDGPSGPGSGSGLCVWTSIEHAARWQNVRALHGLQKKMTQLPGGGWPQRVDQLLPKFAPGVKYLQYEGSDLTVLRLALDSGRMPSITYGGKDWFYGQSQVIQHMVNLVYLDDKWACILDNNHPADDSLVWCTIPEFRARWFGWDGAGRPRSQGWAVFLVAPPPPPLPTLSPARTAEVGHVCDCGPGCPGGCDCGCQPAVVFGQRRGGGGGCPGGVCGPSMGGDLFTPYLPAAVPVMQPHAQPGAQPVSQGKPLEWHALEGYGAQYRWLYQGHKLLGRWNLDTGEYHLRDNTGGKELWFPAVCPVAPPGTERKANNGPGEDVNQKDFGMKWAPKGPESCKVNGKPVTKAEFVEAMVAGVNLPDDSKLLRLTFIAPAAERAKLEAALLVAPLLEWKDRIVYQGYDPGEWAVDPKLGYQPGILIQRPADALGFGQACAFMASFTSAEDVAEGLRRAADPKFDPMKVPSPKAPLPSVPGPGGDPLAGAIPLEVFGLGALMLMAFLLVVGTAVSIILTRNRE